MTANQAGVLDEKALAIAKIIDPHAFLPGPVADEWAEDMVRQSQELALSKASRITAYLAAVPSTAVKALHTKSVEKFGEVYASLASTALGAGVGSRNDHTGACVDTLPDGRKAEESPSLPSPDVAGLEPVAWERIEHPERPWTADEEVKQLRERIEKFGPGVVVEILTTYGLMQPRQGSYAGSLWALAEWAAYSASQLSALEAELRDRVDKFRMYLRLAREGKARWKARAEAAERASSPMSAPAPWQYLEYLRDNACTSAPVFKQAARRSALQTQLDVYGIALLMIAKGSSDESSGALARAALDKFKEAG